MSGIYGADDSSLYNPVDTVACSGEYRGGLYEVGHRKCFKCGDDANGSVGKVMDPTYSCWACEFCYKHVLLMRELGFKWTEKYIDKQLCYLNTLDQTPKVCLAVEAYQNQKLSLTYGE